MESLQSKSRNKNKKIEVEKKSHDEEDIEALEQPMRRKFALCFIICPLALSVVFSYYYLMSNHICSVWIEWNKSVSFFPFSAPQKGKLPATPDIAWPFVVDRAIMRLASSSVVDSSPFNTHTLMNILSRRRRRVRNVVVKSQPPSSFSPATQLVSCLFRSPSSSSSFLPAPYDIMAVRSIRRQTWSHQTRMERNAI